MRIHRCDIKQFHSKLPYKWRLTCGCWRLRVEWVDFACSRALYCAIVHGKEKRSYRRISVNSEMRHVVVHVRRREEIAITGPLYDKYVDYVAKSILE